MIASARLLRTLFAIDLFAFLCALSLATITSTGPAERALGRSVAILTEVDTYLDQHFATLQQQAGQTQDQQLTLPNFPIDASFTPAEILRTDRRQFRAQLLHRAGAILNHEGTSAFRQQESDSATSASPDGALRAAMETLRPVPHRALVGVSVGLGIIAGLFAFMSLRGRQGFAQLRALGILILVPSAIFLALVLVAWAALRLAAASTDDYVTHHFLLLAGQLVWAPLRDGLVVMVGGAAFAAAGALLAPGNSPQYA